MDADGTRPIAARMGGPTSSVASPRGLAPTQLPKWNQPLQFWAHDPVRQSPRHESCLARIHRLLRLCYAICVMSACIRTEGIEARGTAARPATPPSPVERRLASREAG